MKRWQFDQLLTNSFQLWCDFIISMGRPDNEHTARLKQWQARRTMLLAEQNNRWACHLLGVKGEGLLTSQRPFEGLGSNWLTKTSTCKPGPQPRHETQNGKPWDEERAPISKTSCWSDQQPPTTPPESLNTHFTTYVRVFQGSCYCHHGSSTELRETKGPDFHYQFPNILGKLTACLYLYTLSPHCSYWREKSTHTANLPSQNWSGVNESISNLYCKWGWYISVTFQTITHSQH